MPCSLLTSSVIQHNSKSSKRSVSVVTAERYSPLMLIVINSFHCDYLTAVKQRNVRRFIFGEEIITGLLKVGKQIGIYVSYKEICTIIIKEKPFKGTLCW